MVIACIAMLCGDPVMGLGTPLGPAGPGGGGTGLNDGGWPPGPHEPGGGGGGYLPCVDTPSTIDDAITGANLHPSIGSAADMAITRETVLHVAKLARLELGEDEVELMQRDLGGMLEYVALLSELDTEGVPETAHVAATGMPFRSDQPIACLPNETALAEAPRQTGGSFAVPAFVDES
ncbi:MAG TPA: Asp-tRNA(Asn)/Glu-tRNA(Gln) amidotransferase subunit GatC [Polyangiaceae bacterium]|nr:Asp-tRNA(Asn)/Glu-tRNA(Gln) amidotransferase subunit GatC [Polyangiaceae bacterium]